ncbi:MAG: membrane protein insertion efficiency factor YidD [Chloroflexi bacterium]|nr:membrane protein insertion efficiency factor YidD [Chloroflexota bacterium]
MSLGSSVALRLIQGYRLAISPLLPPSCRYAPTCSEYCYDAIVEHGLLLGGWLGIKRVARCHPFHPGGADPVPEIARDDAAVSSRTRRT